MNHLRDMAVVITGVPSGIGAVTADRDDRREHPRLPQRCPRRPARDAPPEVPPHPEHGPGRRSQVGDGAGVHSATKFFVRAMTESMRKELGVREGIKASTISPGVIGTGRADKVTDPVGRTAAREPNALAISPHSVADAVVHALDQPADATVDDLIISPTRQNR